MPSHCKSKENRPDVQPCAQYCLKVDESKVRLPPRYDVGAATADGNNCLIHTIYQLIAEEKWEPGEAKNREKYCREIRSHLAEAREARKTDFRQIS